ARMIGDYVYLLTEDPASWYDDYVKMPEVSENGEVILRPDVWCPIVPSWNYVFHTITSFNVGGGFASEPDAESFLLGYSNTLYVSQENIYLAYPARGVYGGGPVRIMETGADDATAGDGTEDDNREKTVINRFAIDKGDITYKATGTVPGHLLNQFSLDEYRENLRVATTVDGWTDRGSYRYNNVYVLSPDLDIIGKLEFLAPDERIYSTRFMGDKLYMVTFKQIDPLFVIDLSNPRKPGVLGELKIPGYSDYLHPYDENHIIGVGKETSENKWGGVSVAGVKIALFDVTDVNNPKLIDKVEIGEAGTDSEALYDHKAFLFDRTKNILVIPVREVQNVPVSGSKYSGSYSRKIWQGAYVYGLSPADGFTLKGTVRHNEDDSYYSFWGSPSAIKRSLYMDDVLYTISKELIVMSDLTDLKNRIGEIDLPKSQDNGRYYPSRPLPEPLSTPVMV
ncbi:MAG: beta-propeller domain-containing protein, partial [Methanogenium sp.]|nr:beta-propeller domain-containing protein [Methanogenium sp.]